MRNILCFIYSLILIDVLGQTGLPLFSKTSIKSPESYSFEKYGNIPINLYTGSIDLKIPITSINVGGYEIPVYISYDSSGFIPHKKSDLAGVNWSLIIGGRITRILNQVPDEYIGQPESNGTSSMFGPVRDYHGFLYGVKKNPSTNYNVYDVKNGTGYIYSDHSSISWALGKPISNAYEGTPDVFSFSANGLYGKFIVGNDGSVLVQSSDPGITVDLSKMAMYGGKGFCNPPESIITIIDSKGNKYVFGGDLSKYELSYSNENVLFDGGFTGFPIISSFSLSKIILNNGNIIDFDYEKGNLDFGFCHNPNLLIGNSNKLLSIETSFQEGGRGEDWYSCGEPANDGCKSGTLVFSTAKETFSLLKKSLLTKISSGFETIKVNYSDIGYPIKHRYDAYKYLNEWVVSDIETYSNEKLVKKMVFSYSHLGGEFKRPFLKTLKEVVNNFEYNFEYNLNVSLPPYYTKGIDHWGYWNGLDTNVYLSPVDTYNYNTGDYTLNNTYRDPNLNLFSTGLLSKVIYPTKGYTTFDYEPHEYSKRLERNSSSDFLPKIMNNKGYAGGARIKTIKSYSSNNNLSFQKEYRYTNEYKMTKDSEVSVSSGILMHWPRYFYSFRFKKTGSPNYQNLIIRNSSNVQTTSLDSYNVGYSKVFEITDGKGYIESVFSSYETHPDQFYPSATNVEKYLNNTYEEIYPLSLYKNFSNLHGIDNSILRGKLLKQYYFSNDNSKDTIRTIEFEYTDNIDFNKNNSFDENNFVSYNHLTGIWVQGYKKYMNNSYLKKKITKNFFNGNVIKTVNENFYESSYHLNISSEKNITSENTIIETVYKYAYEKDNQYLKDKNIVGIPLQTIKRKITNEITQPLSDVETKYPTSQTEATTKTAGLPLPYEVVSQDLQTSTQWNKEVTYDKYDSKGNILQYSEKGIKPIVIIWGYHQTQPIAKIEGAKYEDIKTNTLITSIINASNLDASDPTKEGDLLTAFDNLRKGNEFKDYQITTYTYNPLIGVTSITPPNGIREIYKYDTANRLQSVVDVNGNILKEYNYNYQKDKFYNTLQIKDFYKNNCSPDENGSVYRYVVPEKKYYSIISIEDANQKALDEINANGQNMANLNGTCSPKPKFYNTAQWKEFVKQDCPSGFIGRYIYTVPANKYFSYESIEAANLLALDDINTNGQNATNLNAQCEPMECNYYDNSDIYNQGWARLENSKIYLDLSFEMVNNQNINWYNGVLFGVLEGDCFSKTEKYVTSVANYGTWGATIKANGEVYLKFLPSISYPELPQNGTQISLELSINP